MTHGDAGIDTTLVATDKAMSELTHSSKPLRPKKRGS
jgi:hypothetical protein